jgi:hypothetical protein
LLRKKRCCLLWAFCLAILSASQAARGQDPPRSPYFARLQSFGVLAAYSNDSSHIVLGEAEQRRILNLGVSYSRRILLSRVVNWQYDGELLPVALESDPLTLSVNQETSPVAGTFIDSGLQPMETCAPFTNNYSYTINGVIFSGADTFSCSGRQWTIGEAISPVGMQWNFRPRSKVQPLVEGHGGYMYSTKAIPIAQAGSFNFTFDVGVGLELYRSRSQSIRAEYRIHHISNHTTALYNPGIDNGLFQVSYVFGR